jgi:hypothetical protein
MQVFSGLFTMERSPPTSGVRKFLQQSIPLALIATSAPQKPYSTGFTIVPKRLMLGSMLCPFFTDMLEFILIKLAAGRPLPGNNASSAPLYLNDYA